MVALPLFKLAALVMRHVSKYGANYIKNQAHDHPRFRSFAARSGQMMHQFNMRLAVAVLRNPNAEREAREKAEAPTVKTEEQARREEEKKARSADASTTAPPGKEDPYHHHHHHKDPAPKSVWKRQFRRLPEAKAVDLFADVTGDAFILVVGAALVVYEYWRSASRPDPHAEKIKELDHRLAELREKEEELEERETRHRQRVENIEDALKKFKDPVTKRPLLAVETPA